MGHRPPLSQGHFNNPHLQYSTCCLHRDNFGTQKPTRLTWGKDSWRGRGPGATAPPHFILRGKWGCLEFLYAWGWGSRGSLSPKHLNKHGLNLLPAHSASPSRCACGSFASLRIIFDLFCIMQLKLSNMAHALRIYIVPGRFLLLFFFSSPFPSFPYNSWHLLFSEDILWEWKTREKASVGKECERWMRITHDFHIPWFIIFKYSHKILHYC